MVGLFDKLLGKKKSNIEKAVDVPVIEPKVNAASEPTNVEIRIPCGVCRGYYKVREGKYGVFAGCSNYPSCRSTLNLPDLVLKYIQLYGLNIYCWNRKCYKCGKETAVYSYYLDYDLADLDEFFSMGGPTVGLGDLSYVDELLSKQIPTIQLRYSNTTKELSINNL